jgi:type IV secretory pathway VirB10-like protein
MAMQGSIRREERIGLAVAFGLHLLLVLVFLVQPGTREAIEPAQRMTVNLASEVGLEAAAPVPVPESRAAIAPTLSDTPAPAPEPAPQPQLERPVAADTPARARPRPQPSRATTPPRSTTKGGGSRVGDNFLAGMGDSTRTTETRAPASAIGASERASLLQAITREVKPRWQPPSGPDVDQLVSKIRFRLNPDGSLAGRPELVSQRGENATNRTQAGRHGEQAIRAVQLAAPFDLPARFYDAWKTVTLDFDWKLAQ